MWRIRCQIKMLHQRIMTRTNAFTTAGDVASGDIQLKVGSDLAGVYGVMILQQVRSLHFCRGQTQKCYRIPYPIQDYQCLS